MSSPFRLAAFLAVALAAMLAWGCGGEDQEASVSKATFVKQADRICVAAVKDAKRDVKGDTGDFSAILGGALQTEAERIEALPMPEDEDQVQAMLTPVREAVAAFEAGTDESAARANRLVSEAEELANDYGLKSCWISSAA